MVRHRKESQEPFRLHQFQLSQQRHDERFHKDIYDLSQQGRFKHAAFHFGKYTGRIAQILDGIIKEGSHSPAMLSKTLTDSFIMVLNLAGIFDIDLEKSIMTRIDSTHLSMKVSDLEKSASKLPHPWVLEKNIDKKIRGLLIDLAISSGVLHKISESLDHMEELSRTQIRNVIVDLFITILVAGDVFRIHYEITVRERWQEIEQKKIL